MSAKKLCQESSQEDIPGFKFDTIVGNIKSRGIVCELPPTSRETRILVVDRTEKSLPNKKDSTQFLENYMIYAENAIKSINIEVQSLHIGDHFAFSKI